MKVNEEEKQKILESVKELRKFERANPRCIMADGSVRFPARVTWCTADEYDDIEKEIVYAVWGKDDSNCIELEKSDGKGGYKVYWRFYADICHDYYYDSSKNFLRAQDSRGEFRGDIKPEFSNT